MATPGRPATWRCRRRRASRSASRSGRPRRSSSRWRRRGGRGVRWPRGCSGPIIAPSSGAIRRRRNFPNQETPMVALDGPRIEPRSGGAARQLVVFLHGYGADGNDLIEIGRAWQDLLPQTAFLSPHAPEPCGQAPVGRQWFPLTFRSQNERWDGVNKARPALDQFLDAELARRNLPPSVLAL